MEGGSLSQFYELQLAIDTYYHLLFVGVLISGGWTSSSSRSGKVELFNLVTKKSCVLPQMAEVRSVHTSVNGIICGGWDGNSARTSCVDISSGSWSSDNYQPIRPRAGHVAWNVRAGEVILLGGWDSESQRTTDVVYTNGTVVPGFNLQYDVR